MASADTIDIIQNLRNDATTRSQTLAIEVADAAKKTMTDQETLSISKIQDAGAEKTRATQANEDIVKGYLANVQSNYESGDEAISALLASAGEGAFSIYYDDRKPGMWLMQVSLK